MKKKGININLLFVGVFLLMAVIIVFFAVQVRQANVSIEKQSQIETNRKSCERAGQMLADGSDYLTDQAWNFVATGNRESLDHYWYEVDQSKNRDKAVENLRNLSLTEKEQEHVEQAKLESDGLIEGETWAMRLVADSIGMKTKEMPSRVAAVTYANGEDALTSDEKKDLASNYIFGEEYTNAKQSITGHIKAFRQSLRERKTEELDGAVSQTESVLIASKYLMLALVITFVLAAAFLYFFIIRPFSSYTRALKQAEEGCLVSLTPAGARETRAFARAFNQVYRDWYVQKQQMEEERYRFHVALDNSSVIIYEYDAVSDIYRGFGNLEQRAKDARRAKSEYSIENFGKKHLSRFCKPADMKRIHKMMEGLDCRPMEFQLQHFGGRPLWVRVTATPVYGEDHKVVKLIGKISNIQEEKEKEFALADARNRDKLTGLYNREIGIRKAREYMETKSPAEICGIMLLDMDNFGKINESEGHVFADAILQDVADILRAKTSPDDILVRLGGDEFMLFIKGCPKSRATILGPEIAHAVEELSDLQNSDLKISVSIGMCVTEVVDEYGGLYRCAESTLEYVKEHTKGQAACYLDTSNAMGMMLTQMYPEQYIINEIDRSEAAKEDIPAFALDLLGKAKNLNDAIYLLLARVGRICKLDRILLVEVDTEYLSCRVVHQWVRDALNKESTETSYLTKEQLKEISAAYDDQGLCDRRIITGECEMKSILHAAIWNYGECVGAMSFELMEARQWTKEEKQLLSELTRIISSFTLKARADAVSKAKTDFLSRMSHEIRTPMNAITGMTVIAKTVLNDPQKMTDCLDKIDSANKYLMSLINDVLDMSRIESGKLEIHREPIDLGAFIERLDAMIRPQTEEKDLRFVIQNEFSEQRPVMADELRINQVLVNLLGNAVKFTPEGGTITLAVETADVGEEGVALKFSVLDTGIGISKEAQGRIFNAFEQAGSETAANYGGTGLGLAISSRLIQMMGGNLDIDSEPGKGSCFYFTIELAYAPDEQKENVELRPEEDRLDFDAAGRRLLLAEDNEINSEIAQEILKMHGFEVETAVNGKEAVRLFEQNVQGYYDAILMDIRMPVMDGMEATRRIRMLGKPDSRTVPIIAMTANAFDEDMKSSLENGMDGHLSKPIDVDALLETLGRLISMGEQENGKK